MMDVIREVPVYMQKLSTHYHAKSVPYRKKPVLKALSVKSLNVAG